MNEFVAYLLETFEQFGPIQARRMFGGHGSVSYTHLRAHET